MLLGVFDPVLFDQERYEREYNCSFFDVDSIPVEKRRRLFLGSICIILFVVFECLYIPCVYAITQLQIGRGIGKLMIALGIFDTLGLFGSGLLVGYYSVTGMVWCTNPRFMLVADLYAMYFWATGSVTNVLLAANRCIQMHRPSLARRLFDGPIIWLWIALIIVYGLVGILGARPVCFSSLYMIAFFNPYEGYFPDREGKYRNYLHTFNNFFVAFGILTMYLLFFLGLWIRRRVVSFEAVQMRRAERQTFYQIAVLSSLEVTTCTVYMYIQFVRSTQFVYYLGTFTYLLRQGCPSLIYLIANRRIRSIVRSMFGLEKSSTIAYKTSTVNSGKEHSGSATTMGR